MAGMQEERPFKQILIMVFFLTEVYQSQAESEALKTNLFRKFLATTNLSYRLPQLSKDIINKEET